MYTYIRKESPGRFGNELVSQTFQNTTCIYKQFDSAVCRVFSYNSTVRLVLLLT